MEPEHSAQEQSAQIDTRDSDSSDNEGVREDTSNQGEEMATSQDDNSSESNSTFDIDHGDSSEEERPDRLLDNDTDESGKTAAN